MRIDSARAWKLIAVRLIGIVAARRTCLWHIVDLPFFLATPRDADDVVELNSHVGCRVLKLVWLWLSTCRAGAVLVLVAHYR